MSYLLLFILSLYSHDKFIIYYKKSLKIPKRQS